MKIRLRQGQEKSSGNREKCPIMGTSCEPIVSFLNDPVGFSSDLSRVKRSVLNTIFGFHNRHYYVTLSHKTLAKRSHCSVSQVKRVLPELKEAGLIGIVGRYEQSSLFRISSWFYQPKNRDLLKNIFMAFCFFPSMLLSVCNGDYKKNLDNSRAENELLCLDNYIFIKNISCLTRSKINNSTVRQTQKTEISKMIPESQRHNYPHMTQRAQSKWGEKRPGGSMKQYSDSNRPQCNGGSMESELNRKKRLLDEEAYQRRMLDKELQRDSWVSSEKMKDDLSKQWWML